jgi:hypothetical protein
MPSLLSRRMRWCVTPGTVAGSVIVTHSSMILDLAEPHFGGSEKMATVF